MLESIDHLNIVVRDLDSMLRFYTETLGLTVTKRVSISGEWIDRTVGLRDVLADVAYDSDSDPISPGSNRSTST